MEKQHYHIKKGVKEGSFHLGVTEKEIEKLAEAILNGDRYALSRAITLIESDKEEDASAAENLLNRCLEAGRISFKIGISGSPGVGKSSFIDVLGMLLVDKAVKPAVLTIDPSSKNSKGSILADKTRMHQLSKSDVAYIRPSPSAGQLGGIARKSYESAILCEAAGYDPILIETVGVGQSETDVERIVDFFILLILPGSGDEIQGIKRGIVELADLIVINKADGNRVKQAKNSQRMFQNALQILLPQESGRATKVMLASALNGSGIPEIWNEIKAYETFAKNSSFFNKKRKQQKINRFEDILQNELASTILTHQEIFKEKERLIKGLIAEKISIHTAINEMKKKLYKIYKINDRRDL